MFIIRWTLTKQFRWKSQQTIDGFNLVLIDPLIVILVPLTNTLGEPEIDLSLGVLNTVGTVDNVTKEWKRRIEKEIPTDLNTEVTTDGTGSRLGGLGGAEHLSAAGDDVITFPDHSNDGTRAHVLNKTVEEGLGGELSVVLAEELLGGHDLLAADELESLLLESGHNLTNKSSLDTIGLSSNESTFLGADRGDWGRKGDTRGILIKGNEKNSE